MGNWNSVSNSNVRRGASNDGFFPQNTQIPFRRPGTAKQILRIWIHAHGPRSAKMARDSEKTSAVLVSLCIILSFTRSRCKYSIHYNIWECHGIRANFLLFLWFAYTKMRKFKQFWPLATFTGYHTPLQAALYIQLNLSNHRITWSRAFSQQSNECHANQFASTTGRKTDVQTNRKCAQFMQ